MMKILFFLFAITSMVSSNLQCDNSKRFSCSQSIFEQESETLSEESIDIESSDNSLSDKIDFNNSYRIYVYFPGIRPADNVTWFKGHFYSSDGKYYECYATHSNSVGISDYSFCQRLMYFDIPNFTELCYFDLGPAGFSYAWTTSPLTKISGIWYVFHISTYDWMESDSGWRKPLLKTLDFADCILSSLNENSDLPTIGYNSFPSISKHIFNYLTDYDEQSAKNIKWIDSFTGEETDFLTKWNNLKNKYNENANATKSFWFHWEYILSATILCSSVLLAIRYIRRKDEN